MIKALITMMCVMIISCDCGHPGKQTIFSTNGECITYKIEQGACEHPIFYTRCGKQTTTSECHYEGIAGKGGHEVCSNHVLVEQQ